MKFNSIITSSKFTKFAAKIEALVMELWSELIVFDDYNTLLWLIPTATVMLIFVFVILITCYDAGQQLFLGKLNTIKLFLVMATVVGILFMAIGYLNAFNRKRNPPPLKQCCKEG